ncbi:MAG: porin, partial [Kiloniellales bacterium]|nr:porin [Kiloniellales bacterium]
MKKVLYGSTALIAAGAMASTPAAAEEGIKLGLGGYYNTFFWIGSQDEASGDPRDLGTTGLFNEGEVHFKGSTTLDNGITFGVQMELEINGSGDRIDEHYAFISGSFGRVVIGDENTVAYQMQYGAPNVGVPLNSGWITNFVPPPQGTTSTATLTGGGGISVMTGVGTTIQTASFRTPALSTYVDLSNDDSGIQYYSPRFSGFQVGLGYVPVAEIDGEGKNSPVQADKNSELHDTISVGANFVESFGGFDVAVAGGYRRAEAASGQDPEMWSAGLNLGFAGFTVGGSFAVEDSARATD